MLKNKAVLESEVRAVRPIRLFTYIFLPIIGRILDIISTVYAIGLGKKNVNGWIFECLEGNPRALDLMATYPNYWYIIATVGPLILLILLLSLRGIGIKKNIPFLRFFLVLTDFTSLVIIFLAFIPFFNNLAMIRLWHNYQGGLLT